jgi:hypothetical protein
VTLGSNAEGVHATASRSESNGSRIAEGEVATRGAFGSAQCGSTWRRGCVASQLRRTSPGRARESQSRRHGPSARQEVNKRQISIESTPPLTSGLRRSNVGSRPGSSAQAGPANRVLQTPSGYTQSLIVCRSRHRSIGRLPRESGSARRSRPPSTYDDVRASWRAPKSVPWSRRTPQPGCSTAPTSRQRGARARSGTRVLRTHASKPSVVEQGPPGEAAFGPARSRRKIGTE